jgi:hypothetical protein
MPPTTTKIASLAEPRAKLERAAEHLAELGRAADEFFSTEPYNVMHQRGPEAHVFRLHVVQEPPMRLGTIFGDAMVNMRSALDQLVIQLGVLNGAPRRRGPAFPILTDAAEYVRTGRNKLRDIAPAHADRIEALQPYPWRRAPRVRALAAVARFSNLDKHRAIQTAFSTPTHGPELPFTIRREPVEAEFYGEVEITGYGRALQDGDEIARMRFGAVGPQPRVKLYGELILDVAFGEDGLALGALPHIHRHISDVVESFAQDFES